jgi:hypothetical protein
LRYLGELGRLTPLRFGDDLKTDLNDWNDKDVDTEDLGAFRFDPRPR